MNALVAETQAFVASVDPSLRPIAPVVVQKVDVPTLRLAAKLPRRASKGAVPIGGRTECWEQGCVVLLRDNITLTTPWDYSLYVHEIAHTMGADEAQAYAVQNAWLRKRGLDLSIRLSPSLLRKLVSTSSRSAYE